MDELKVELQKLIDQTINNSQVLKYDDTMSMQQLLSELSVYYRELEFQNDELKRTYSILENTKKELLDLFESSPVGYLIFDEEYRIQTSNFYFERLTGVTKNQLKQIKVTSLISCESQDEFYLHIRRIQKYEYDSGCELYITNANQKIPVKIETRLLLVNDRNLYMSAVTDLTSQKKIEISLKQSQEDLKRFASHIHNVREEERLELSREIHDELGQLLIAMKIDLGVLKKSVETGNRDKISNCFDSLDDLVNNSLKSARRIMTDLRPEILDILGFTESVRQYAQNFQKRYGIETDFENGYESMNLSLQQSVTLFRIIQEALNNVAKHSKARSVKILIKLDCECLLLSVSDDGIGFDVNQHKHFDSYGLLGMKERVYLLDGELFITSQVNVGTRVLVKIPVKS